jgi:AP endonuclease-2
MEVAPTGTSNTGVIRVLSWNIGLKALKNTLQTVSQGSLASLLLILKADILCLQETKLANVGELTELTALAPGYTSFFHCNRKHEAYAGVATIVRDGIPIVCVNEGVTGALTTRNQAHATPSSSPTGPPSPPVASPHSTVVTVIEDDDEAGDEKSVEEAVQLQECADTPGIRRSDSGGYHEMLDRTEIRPIPPLDIDSEGRCLITDHREFVLLNCYVPALSCTDERYEFKLAFHEALRQRVAALQAAGRKVIVAGDLNVTHKAIDHCDPTLHLKERGMLSFDDFSFRRWMTSLLVDTAFDAWRTCTPGPEYSFPGVQSRRLVDPFRHFFPDREKAFTCWSQVTSARATNYGTRLDYTLVDAQLMDKDAICAVVAADIMQDFMGSDHCPVYVDLTAPEAWGRQTGNLDGLSTVACTLPPSISDLSVNAMPAFSKRQQSLKNFFSKAGQAHAPAGLDGTTTGSVAAAPQQSFMHRKPVATQRNMFDNFLKKTDVSTATKIVTIEEDDVITECRAVELELVPRMLSNPSTTTVAVSAWSKLLSGRLPPPNCRCGIPSIERTVKEGKNTNKLFFVCTKPAGKAGDANARCNFFMWMDEWRNIQASSSASTPTAAAAVVAAGGSAPKRLERAVSAPESNPKRNRFSNT